MSDPNLFDIRRDDALLDALGQRLDASERLSDFETDPVFVDLSLWTNQIDVTARQALGEEELTAGVVGSSIMTTTGDASRRRGGRHRAGGTVLGRAGRRSMRVGVAAAAAGTALSFSGVAAAVNGGHLPPLASFKFPSVSTPGQGETVLADVPSATRTGSGATPYEGAGAIDRRLPTSPKGEQPVSPDEKDGKTAAPTAQPPAAGTQSERPSSTSAQRPGKRRETAAPGSAPRRAVTTPHRHAWFNPGGVVTSRPKPSANSSTAPSTSRPTRPSSSSNASTKPKKPSGTSTAKPSGTSTPTSPGSSSVSKPGDKVTGKTSPDHGGAPTHTVPGTSHSSTGTPDPNKSSSGNAKTHQSGKVKRHAARAALTNRLSTTRGQARSSLFSR